ncbi:hypothetical protein AAC387_Pa02g1512 [Persea americana]
MEDKVEIPERPEISEKSRSLDAQSFSGEKSPNGQEGRVLKRKHFSSKKNEEEISLGQVKKRRKGRKEVSLSSLENASDKSKKGLDSTKSGLKLNGFAWSGKNSSKRNRKKGNGAVSSYENLQNLGSFMPLSHSLDDNVIVVPKRPRGFSGRNKFQSNHVGKQKVNSKSKGVISQLTTSTSKSCAGFSRSKLNGDPKEPVKSRVGKRKKVLDELKDNSSSGPTSFSQIKGDDGGSVQVTGSRAAKRARRNHGEGGKPDGDKQAREEVKWSPVKNCVSAFEELLEDDEENLEQNAARMLSSRFDPNCTGFSGRGSASRSQSADGSFFSPMFEGAFKSLGVVASEGLEAVSDSAGRVLRPRKQHKHKGIFRRQRRHFYEVCSLDLDPYWVVNQRIKVFWPLDQSWYFGLVNDYDSVSKLHYIKYDDRDEEWIDLQNERFKLLLLPGEVPGKSYPDKPGLKGCKKRDEDVDVNFMDENVIGNFMESEPIISWLSRSAHRMKSSQLSIMKKQAHSRVLKNLPQPSSFENSIAIPVGSDAVGPSIPYADKFYMGSAKPDRSAVGEVTEKSLEAGACSSDRKMPLVYYRRRFLNRGQGVTNMLVEKSVCRSADGSVSLLASVIDRVGALNEFKIPPQDSRMKELKLVDRDISLTSAGNCALLKFSFSLVSEAGLKLSLPPVQVFDLAFGAENSWLYTTLVLFKYGKLVTLWPDVQVEMLFVDNIVGLRFMLFEGCLKQAVAFLCFILTFFHQPKEYGQLGGDLQLPVTSIRFKLSGLRDLGRQLEFVFYNFLELKSSKWLNLDNKLKNHCIFTKELPLSECTYANIKNLQSGSEEIHSTPICRGPVSFQERSRRNTLCRNCSSCKFDERLRRFPPLVLSFAAVPTFFLSLHLNVLMENNVASVSLQNQCRVSLHECSENFDKLTGGDVSFVCDSLIQESEIAIENMRCSSKYAAADCVHSKVEPVATSVDDGTDLPKTSRKPLNSALDVSGVSVGCQGAGKSISDRNVTGLEGYPCHTGSWTCIGQSSSAAPDCPSFPEKSENGGLSQLNNISMQTSSVVDVESQSLNQPAQTAKAPLNNLSSQTMAHSTICSPNPTAPRSMWHRNRHVSRPKLWPDFVSSGFVNGHKKPRSQVSYLLPLGGYSFGSKPRSHRRKAHCYRRIKDDNVKKVSDGSGSPQGYPDSISCDANILVTVGDRGWRECGAQVVLESVDHKDWNLLVKIAGTTKYSHKAHQFLQPGMTNRYTHAMMWKGGKDWILEFPDKSQWILFKDMYEECYNRNIRSALVKNIPIPGVRVVDDSDHTPVEVPFVRTQKYFRQIGTEVDVAMDPSRIVYDMETDDEEWISKLRISHNYGTKTLEISEEIFERVMDTFEKIAYAQQRENFTSDEIAHLMAGVGPMDVIKAIYEHWQQKRQRKGMPLIRQLQPALWERYHDQVKEWESAMSKKHNFSDGYKEKVVLSEKPPMFAFCLRPRGLEAPNKGTKQRSQRKFMVLGHHSGVLFGDTDGLQITGRKLNGFAVGDEKALVTDRSYVSSDVSPLLQTLMKLSPSDAVGPGIPSVTSDWSERNQYSGLHRNKMTRVGTNLSARSSQMASIQSNQRVMGMRNGAGRLNIGSSEWHSPKSWELDGFQRKSKNHFGGPDFDEFRLRDASGAAQHALNMAKLKRERAYRLFIKADNAVHKAVIALMTAEALKVSGKDSNGEG